MMTSIASRNRVCISAMLVFEMLVSPSPGAAVSDGGRVQELTFFHNVLPTRLLKAGGAECECVSSLRAQGRRFTGRDQVLASARSIPET